MLIRHLTDRTAIPHPTDILLNSTLHLLITYTPKRPRAIKALHTVEDIMLMQAFEEVTYNKIVAIPMDRQVQAQSRLREHLPLLHAAAAGFSVIFIGMSMEAVVVVDQQMTPIQIRLHHLGLQRQV